MSIVFIDKGIQEFDTLYNELSKNNVVYLLNENDSAFSQISELIGNNTNLGSIQIFSHGRPGVIDFLAGSISTDNLLNYSHEINSIANSLGPNGHINLYGCNIAKGDKGLDFINLFSSISNLGIAASDDFSGSNNLFADWDLEIKVGNISQPSLIPNSFSGLLGTPTITNLDTNISLTENDALFALDTDITINSGTSSGDKYEGGWLEFSLDDGTSTDFLRFTDDGSASTENGKVSIVNSIIYVGNGTGAAILGNVDSTKNGLNGNPLRINISNKFQNGDFESNDGASFSNWQVIEDHIIFGTTTIGGLNTPNDSTFPTPTGSRANNDPLVGELSDQIPPKAGANYDVLVSSDDGGGGSFSVQLRSTGVVIDNTGLRSDGSTRKSGYDIIRGPALYSDNTVYLRTGDQVSFRWKAEGGNDAYDVYGYIVNVDNNDFVTILDETGTYGLGANNTSWATETVTITDEGSYKFVFVAGTYDYTGGYWAGAQLFVDNVTVTESIIAPTVSDEMIQTIARKVKYESTSEDPPATKTLTVSATSIKATDNSELTGQAIATLNFTKTNDAPTITSADSSSINENMDSSTVVYDGEATDVDSADTLTFSLSGADALLFDIDADDGEVRLKASADYETKDTYNFDIVATDDGVGTLSASKSITLNINDVNDPPSVISGATGTIAENADPSTVAYDAQATDPDADTITFSITGTDESFFTIDSDDGEIRLENSANFEVKNSYSINVIATDNGSTPANSSKAIIINVTDENDDPVAVDDMSITTLNTAKNNIDVITNDSDEDLDSLSIQSISYSGTGNATTDGTTIDYTPPTGVPSLTETISYVVSDGNGGTSSGTLTMRVVTPLIQGPSNPAGSSTSSISIDENNTTITTLTANVDVTWSINSGLDGDKFSLDSDGKLTFNTIPNYEIPIDTDTNNTYEVEVKAVETGNGYSSTQIITVTILNVNEADPVIDTTDLTGTVIENADVSTVIYKVNATDADVTDILSYTISGTDAALLTIDNDDGEVRLNSSADFETKNFYSFNVIAADPDGSDDTEAVTVNVTNANEAPVITSLSTATLAENSLSSTVFYTVTATDVDAGDNFSFSITGGDSNLIDVDADDGEVRLKSPADYETKSNYTFNVIVTDDGVGNLSDSELITLTITNANDAPLVNSISQWNISEDHLNIKDVTSLFADPDDDALSFSARSVGGGVLPGWITFDNTSNQLNATPTRTELGRTDIEITADDGNGQQVTGTLPIYVKPINNSATGDVTIVGTPSLGNSLSVDTSLISDQDGLGPLSYKWFRESSLISDVDSSIYTIINEDLGKEIRVDVKFTDLMGNNESISSAPVNVVSSINESKNNTIGDRNVFKDSFSQITLKGGSGDDLLVAIGKNSAAEGGDGSDIVIGGTGNNPLKGNKDSDYLIGDLLVSEFFFGNDTLTGGPGNDLIEGGFGADIFVFSPSDGSDIIAKFNVNTSSGSNFIPTASDFEPGEDKVDFSDFQFINFEDVISKFSTTNEGHAQFSHQDSTILFYGISINQLSESDFILS